jgi:hypothetical protein
MTDRTARYLYLYMCDQFSRVYLSTNDDDDDDNDGHNAYYRGLIEDYLYHVIARYQCDWIVFHSYLFFTGLYVCYSMISVIL